MCVLRPYEAQLVQYQDLLSRPSEEPLIIYVKNRFQFLPKVEYILWRWYRAQ